MAWCLMVKINPLNLFDWWTGGEPLSWVGREMCGVYGELQEECDAVLSPTLAKKLWCLFQCVCFLVPLDIKNSQQYVGSHQLTSFTILFLAIVI